MTKAADRVKPFIEFNITEKCNYCCEYCSQGFLNKHEPLKLKNASDEVIEGFLSLLEKLGSEYEVNLIGGEPFCHPKFIETTERISQLGNKMILYSNMSFPVSVFEKFIDAAGDNLKLIHGALHVSEIKDLDKNIQNIIKIKQIIKDKTAIRIVSVVTEENFETLRYIEKELSKHNIEFIYIRLIKQENREITIYSPHIEEYLKIKEHKYNKDMLKAREINTSKVLCFAGSKLLHVDAQGNISRCWSWQSKKEFGYLGNVTEPSSIKLLKGARPCYSPVCYCQHPTARNAYYYSPFTALYRFDFSEFMQKIFSVKNDYSGSKPRKVWRVLGLKISYKK